MLNKLIVEKLNTNLEIENKILCSSYIVRFNEICIKEFKIHRDAINIKDFEKMKNDGTIVDYEIDDIGIKIFIYHNI